MYFCWNFGTNSDKGPVRVILGETKFHACRYGFVIGYRPFYKYGGGKKGIPKILIPRLASTGMKVCNIYVAMIS